VVTAQLRTMAAGALEEWRAARSASGSPLPDLEDGSDLEALTVVVDEVEVGGAVVQYDSQGGRARASLRVLQTTLPAGAGPEWTAVIAALEQRARERGAVTLVTAVAPELAGAFRSAGFQATMTTVAKRLDPASTTELQDDQRVVLRPMTPEERQRFAGEAVGLLRSGMERAGVLSGGGDDLGELGERIARLGHEELPAGELLLMGVLDGVPVGRLWVTLVTDDDGSTDVVGNSVDLFPQFRGQGLTRSLLGALRRHMAEIGVREVRGRLYAHDARARKTVVGEGTGIEDVHLRKDLS
jgi:GNAT superfamily N-acetyltransferase